MVLIQDHTSYQRESLVLTGRMLVNEKRMLRVFSVCEINWLSFMTAFFLASTVTCYLEWPAFFPNVRFGNKELAGLKQKTRQHSDWPTPFPPRSTFHVLMIHAERSNQPGFTTVCVCVGMLHLLQRPRFAVTASSLLVLFFEKKDEWQTAGTILPAHLRGYEKST